MNIFIGSMNMSEIYFTFSLYKARFLLSAFPWNCTSQWEGSKKVFGRISYETSPFLGHYFHPSVTVNLSIMALASQRQHSGRRIVVTMRCERMSCRAISTCFIEGEGRGSGDCETAVRATRTRGFLHKTPFTQLFCPEMAVFVLIILVFWRFGRLKEGYAIKNSKNFFTSDQCVSKLRRQYFTPPLPQR